jgi:hypothetical protein
MSGSRNELVFPFIYKPAQHGWNPGEITQVALAPAGPPLPRNSTQRAALAKLGLQAAGASQLSDPFAYMGAWYDVDAAARALRGIDGERLFRERIFLFNVVIGLEWRPSARTQQQIRSAAARASDFLYDVTDGYMAFGQVTVGGPELLDASDIQVLASNRLYPRSWIDALNKPEKFQPIRVGRGMWQKNRGLLLTWDTPEGYRALVHEWGHYAFGMVDAYLVQRAYHRDAPDDFVWDDGKALSSAIEVAMPEIALSVETIMANQEISEYAESDHVFERIQKRFGSDIVLGDPLDGPFELPLPLPIFPTIAASDPNPAFTPVTPGGPGEELVLPLADLLATVRAEVAAQRLSHQGEVAESCWLYLLKAPFNDDMPARLIAQGKLSDKDKSSGFTLLGAAPGDRVMAVSEVRGYGRVHCGTLVLADGAQASVDEWLPVTPLAPDQPLGGQPFFVDVIPESLGRRTASATPPRVNVAVSVAADQPPDDVYVYACGLAAPADMGWPAPGARPPAGTPTVSPFRPVEHLDGHVLLRWRATGEAPSKYFVCSYSQGGGPSTTAGGKPSITAGSSEGNAMLFFLGPDVQGASPDIAVPDDNAKVRIVTTVLPALRHFAEDTGSEPRSYIFSLASNEPLGDYTATLVLYYDHGAPKSKGGLYIRRWDAAAGIWRRLTTIAPAELAYIALPIKAELETAPGLMAAAGPRIERYRICWERGQ